MQNNQKHKQPIQFDEDDELLDIRYDNIFKAVFTKDTPASKGALSGLVSALIERKVTVQTITANEPPANNAFDRCIRFDIACKAESGELINTEMSFLSRKSDKKAYPNKNIIRVKNVNHGLKAS